MPLFVRRSWSLVLLLAACPPPASDPVTTTTSTTSSETATSGSLPTGEGGSGFSTTGGGLEGTTAPSTAGVSGTTTSPSTTLDEEPSDCAHSFVFECDVPKPECDLWAQDCGPGEKCSSFAQPASETDKWSTRCVPVAPNPLPNGESCQVPEEMFEHGVGYSGIDECDAASVCWDYTYETYLDGQGTCRPRCTGSEDAPVCPQGLFCSIDGTPIWACLDICNPLVADCPADQLCSPVESGFTCTLDTSSESAPVHGPCAINDDCAAGLICRASASSDACDPNDDSCCLPYCDITLDPDPACSIDAGETCRFIYANSDVEAPPGLENVGICTIVP